MIANPFLGRDRCGPIAGEGSRPCDLLFAKPSTFPRPNARMRLLVGNVLTAREDARPPRIAPRECGVRGAPRAQVVVPNPGLKRLDYSLEPLCGSKQRFFEPSSHPRCRKSALSAEICVICEICGYYFLCCPRIRRPRQQGSAPRASRRHHRIKVFKEAAVLYHGTDTNSDPFG